MKCKQAFRDYLEKQGLKSTRQREIIVDEFLACGGHVSTEELYRILREKHPSIGYATVHRTLKLLAECKLAEPRNFGDGQTRYEQHSDEHHHDHLICMACGAIVEFEDETIERLQERVAREHGFEIKRHRLEIYGCCAACAGEKG